jgi:chromosome segregation ATPase
MFEILEKLGDLSKTLINLTDKLADHDNKIEEASAELRRMALVLQQITGSLQAYSKDIEEYKERQDAMIADLKENQRLERENMMLRIGLLIANLEKRLPPPQD